MFIDEYGIQFLCIEEAINTFYILLSSAANFVAFFFLKKRYIAIGRNLLDANLSAKIKF